MRQHLNQSIRILRSAAIPALAGFVIFGLAACGDDDNGGPTGPDVSQQQAEEVAAAVNVAISQTFSITAGGGSASLAPGALTPRSIETPVASETNSYSFDNSTSCPEGGSLSANGDGTITTSGTSSSSTVEWDWNASASYNNCGVQTDQNNIFVLSTPSPIQFNGTGSVTSNEDGSGSGTFTWDYSGTFDWDEQGGPDGSCDVDLSTELNIESANNTLEWTGSIRGDVCGRSVNRTFDTVISI